MVSAENTIRDIQGQELPSSLEFFLNYIGIRDKQKTHTKVVWPEKKEDLTKVSKGWRPSYEGEEPPFQLLVIPDSPKNPNG